jgi:hypothetical protein
MSIDIRRGIRLSLALVWLFVSGLAQAITGPETAQLLNHRYQQTVAACAGNNPAYFCSGVLIRGSEPEHTHEFWMHDSDAVTLGAERFSYVRADIGTQALAQRNGVIFSDSFTAISQGKTLDVLCVYPFVAHIASTRPDYGCGLSSSTPQRLEDPSSCAALGITDATAWLRHFQQSANQPDKQCSFSSQSPTQFKASLEAHQGLDEQWAAQPNEVLTRNWETAQPQRIPLQGLFYDVTQTGGLTGAQKDQRDYFNATGEWLSILRMNLRDGPDAVFGFNLQDQLYIGDQVASRLNARYANTAAICPDGRASYYCNGVLIRTTDASLDFRAWNPSPGSRERDGVSFSYMRADVPLPKLAWSKHQGLIMKELAAPTAHPLELRCSYPYDGATFYRSNSCNQHSGAPEVSRPCDEQGITTAEQWLVYFNALASKHTGCSFGPGPTAFDVSLQARTLLSASYLNEQNEVIIADWGQNIPTRIPLEAFFYTLESAALPAAQFFQHDYFEQTGNFLPIVRVNLAPAADEPVFSYAPEDQLGDLSLRPPRILQAEDDGNGAELDIGSVSGDVTARIDNWPHIAQGQRIWWYLEGTKADGSPYEKRWSGANNWVSAAWYQQGYGEITIPYSDLLALRDGSTFKLEFKSTFSESTDEAQAIPFPLRTYTVRAVELMTPMIDSVKDPNNTDIINGGQTTATSVTLSGKASNDQRVEIFDGNTPKGTADVNGDGDWSLPLSGLSVDAHSFTAQAKYGSEPVSPARTFIVTAPLSINTAVMMLHGFAVKVDWPTTGEDAPANTQVRQASGGTPPYRYTSSNPSVASIVGSNKIRGERNGVARITVTDSKGATVFFSVNVRNVYELVVNDGPFNDAIAARAWIDSVKGVDTTLYNPFLMSMFTLYRRPFPHPFKPIHYWLGASGDGRYTFFNHTEQGLYLADPGNTNIKGAWAFVPL